MHAVSGDRRLNIISIRRSALTRAALFFLRRLAELLQSKQSEESKEIANSLHALVSGGGKKKSPVSAALLVVSW